MLLLDGNVSSITSSVKEIVPFKVLAVVSIAVSAPTPEVLTVCFITPEVSYPTNFKIGLIISPVYSDTSPK